MTLIFIKGKATYQLAAFVNTSISEQHICHALNSLDICYICNIILALKLSTLSIISEENRHCGLLGQNLKVNLFQVVSHPLRLITLTDHHT